MKYKVPTTRHKTQIKAQKYYDELPLIKGLQPKPRPLIIPFDENAMEDDAVEVDTYKIVSCPVYDQCAKIAGVANWDELSCRACPLYRKQELRPRLIRRVKVLAVRCIRKIKQKVSL